MARHERRSFGYAYGTTLDFNTIRMGGDVLNGTLGTEVLDKATGTAGAVALDSGVGGSLDIGRTNSINNEIGRAGFTTSIEGTSDRYQLNWVAGARGKPGVNGDILSATEATRMIADPDFEVLGTNAVSADTACNAEGGITLTTAGAVDDQMILCPHLNASQSGWSQTTWGTDQSTSWECRIKTPAAITNMTIWAGLKLTMTEVTATDANQVFFRYAPATNSGKWEAINSIANVDVETDSGVTVAVSTDYHLAINISSTRIATLYINNVLVGTSTALTTATDLIPYIGVMETTTTVGKAIGVRGQSISRAFA